jgi:hypothetical protein
MALKLNKQIIDKGTVIDRGTFYEVLESPIAKQCEFYVRVDKVHAGKDAALALVSFCEPESKNNLFGAAYEFAGVIDGENFIQQAYQHLKTLPEFSGAQDC